MISIRVYRQRGFVLVMMGLTAFALFGIMGLAVDVGRMYIAKNEAQTFADAGAMAAALRINGTAGGILTTAQLIALDTNRYGLGNSPFTASNVVLQYSTARNGPWVTPAAAQGTPNVTFASVTATPAVNLYFLPLLVQQTTTAVPAVGIATQVPIPGTGLFPFAPIAAAPNTVNFGYTVGYQYSLQWGTQPARAGCANDTPSMIATAVSWGSDHGYYEGTPGPYGNGPTQPNVQQGTPYIVQQIVGDYEQTAVVVGDNVPLSGGESRNIVNSNMATRIQQDTDQTSATFADYTGNGRRIVAVPVVCSGSCTFTTANGNTYTSASYPGVSTQNANLVMGYAPFFLPPVATLPSNGNGSLCAEYIGTAVKDSPTDQALNPHGPGVYQARLVQ
jgi:Flp pilus assembly protein TadG